MKEKIIELIIANRDKFWDEESESPPPNLSEKEQELIIEGDNILAEDIIKLFE